MLLFPACAAHLKPDQLRVLFGENLKASKTQDTPKSFFEYDDEDEALKAAINETTFEEKAKFHKKVW